MSATVEDQPGTQDKVRVPRTPPDAGGLQFYWGKPVSELATVETDPLSEPEKERHRLYALLVMALVNCYWNGNQRGRRGNYPLRPDQREADHHLLPHHNALYVGGDYLGHNIAAIAVDRSGYIIDFDLNHNELFNSSVEHAEARLMRRVFSLGQMDYRWRLTSLPAGPKAGAGDPAAPAWGDAFDPLDGPQPATYTTLLDGVTVYTSLESCSQCSGMMTLAKVKEVVYLQRDPGQNHIGNILRNLTADNRTPQTKYTAPLPIDGYQIDFPYTPMLEERYAKYVQTVRDPNTPFFIYPRDPDAPAGKPPKAIRTTAITSFLCTDAAREVFKQASAALREMLRRWALEYPDYRPDGAAESPPLSNRDVLEEVVEFLQYAHDKGRRGTGHNL